MASSQLIAPMPFLTLDAGCTVTIEAIDPDTGASVTGVVVSLVAIYGVNDVPDDPTVSESLPLTWVSVGDDDPA